MGQCIECMQFLIKEGGYTYCDTRSYICTSQIVVSIFKMEFCTKCYYDNSWCIHTTESKVRYVPLRDSNGLNNIKRLAESLQKFQWEHTPSSPIYFCTSHKNCLEICEPFLCLSILKFLTKPLAGTTINIFYKSFICIC